MGLFNKFNIDALAAAGKAAGMLGQQLEQAQQKLVPKLNELRENAAPSIEKFKEKAPKAAAAFAAPSQYFQNSKDQFNGQELPGTSPFMQTFKSNKSFSIRSGNVTTTTSFAKKGHPNIGNTNPEFNQSSVRKKSIEGIDVQNELKTSSYNEAFGSIGNASPKKSSDNISNFVKNRYQTTGKNQKRGFRK